MIASWTTSEIDSELDVHKLESDGETPPYLRITIPNEAKAIFQPVCDHNTKNV